MVFIFLEFTTQWGNKHDQKTVYFLQTVKSAMEKIKERKYNENMTDI